MPEINHIVFAAQIEYFMDKPIFGSKKVFSPVFQNTVSNTLIIYMCKFQKYLNFIKSNLLFNGSTPEKRRTIAGEADFGEPIKVFNAFV